MRIRRAIARSYWRMSRFSPDDNPPPAGGSGILIGAPHTSNWDFVIMLGLAWRWGISVRWLGKNSLFKRPFGFVMRALGGIPVDRQNPAGLVEELVADLGAGRPTYLVITPEGARSAVPYWKSGFHRIARATGLTVTLGYVDRTTMGAGFGPTLTMTDDVRSDMDKIRAFYAGKVGIRPEGTVVPRLRSEDESAPENTAE